MGKRQVPVLIARPICLLIVMFLCVAVVRAVYHSHRISYVFFICTPSYRYAY